MVKNDPSERILRIKIEVFTKSGGKTPFQFSYGIPEFQNISYIHIIIFYA